VVGRRLVVIRHAKSDWAESGPDIDRPLAERGRRDAPAVGRWLRDHVDRLDLVLCSPAVRARQTWELAAAELDPAPRLRVDDRIYAARLDDLLAAVGELPDEVAAAAVVGHNPGLQDLCALLSGEPAELKTAAVTVLGWGGDWADAGPGVGTVEARARPRG